MTVAGSVPAAGSPLRAEAPVPLPMPVRDQYPVPGRCLQWDSAAIHLSRGHLGKRGQGGCAVPSRRSQPCADPHGELQVLDLLFLLFPTQRDGVGLDGVTAGSESISAPYLLPALSAPQELLLPWCAWITPPFLSC